MDGNKDEAIKCITIAVRARDSGNTDKALRFLEKAEKLYPTQKAKELIEELKNLPNKGEDSESNSENIPNSQKESQSEEQRHGSSNTSQKRSSHGTRRRKHSSHQSKESDSENVSQDAYTDDQVALVKRIKSCKDYYEILDVSKEATDGDLKKSYKKLALKMHPDKNKAPGATEAFKVVSNAYGVLSNPDKRKQYDLYGPEMEQQSRHTHHYDYTHGGFEADITPEELFNMFFGGGFQSSNVYRRRSGHTFTYRREQANEGTGTLLLQLSPILILVFISLLSSFFVSDPIYSLERTNKYKSERHTQRLNIPYYVKENFHLDYNGDIRRIERQVEDDYITHLRTNCFRERSVKENMMWRARSYGDGKLYNQAMNMKTPSCDRLQQGVYS